MGRTNLPGQPLRLVVIGLVALLLLGISAGTYSYITNTAGKGTAPVTQSNAQQNKLSVQATPTSMVAPTATPTANPDNENPYPPHGGTFVMNEPLDTNHYGWQETPTTAVGGACQFVQGGYQAYDPIIEPNPCFAYNTNFINFAYQIDVKFLQTGQLRSGGGILFRGNSTSNKYYFFELYSTGQYSLQVCNGGDCNTQLAGYKTDNQALNAFRAGLNVTNTLAVVAVGTKFDLYLNQQLIKEVVDPNNTYMIGMVGVMVSGGNDKEQRTPATSTPTRAVFSNARVWKL